jgi:PPK2 family polyphosphate:nucleotide phosphotransferase
METKTLIKQAKKLSDKFRVTDGESFRLKKFDPADTLDFTSDDKPRAEELLSDGVQLLAKLQDKLYAENRWAVLLIFQAMDAAGKDGAIKHVMTGINPQGCEVYAFKTPTSEELDHDYLWRCMKRVPERGRIGIFNRSYYEETLVVRVHEEFLANQKLPAHLVTKNIWKERLRDISNFERYLTHNGIAVVKFYLHVSKDEQQKRFLERIDNPDKNWKFSLADIHERQHWSAYMDAYEQTIQATATKFAPWYVVPADNKWFTRMVVASAVIRTLESLDLQYPQLSKAELEALDAARASLEKI